MTKRNKLPKNIWYTAFITLTADYNGYKTNTNRTKQFERYYEI